ncbi:hypothetical protein MM213_11575 [Belliella sp. R4-6]|uniref:mRNA-degrading endonuclease RelE, toxin component of the RelBE toxin-antitoxin system n=1 Tax=Belliella alkalica TaxID=1730871 RepID=A0ABS9VDV9_9BACT|nr:hypothetical protein [Belliella alkalica]MCH7414130.1 hypothetical protein [Belliella alkalica]
MSYKVKSIPEFEKELKKLVKKYPSLKDDFFQLVQDLKNKPDLGVPLYKNCFKIRISIKSKGKSGGGRVITHFAFSDDTVYLLSIYDKSKQESITDTYIKSLLDFLS